MKDVKGVLDHLGYTEIRSEETGEWKRLDSVNGEYGSTDETHLILPEDHGQPDDDSKICRLVDAESGNQRGTAWKTTG